MTMTTMRMSATRAASAAKHDCGCGCGGTGGACCDLECLVRPNFYCGQLLTDADLSAVVQWTRDRLSLSRYRDGWGVVCGLEVTCSEPEGACGCGCGSPKGCTVWIDKGYAVDCCGNDLVVCEPIPVDLGDVCRPDDDPCADPCWPPVKQDPKGARGTVLPDIPLGGEKKIPGAEQMIVDLYLQYGEQPMAGQRPLFRGACADVDACEPSRLLERPVPKLVARAVANPWAEPKDDAEAHWQELVDKENARLDELFADATLDTLIRRLAKWQLHSFCLVMDYIRAQDTLDDEIKNKIRGWLMLDWQMHQLLCECRTCRTDDGVPLARLWLWRKDGRTECCRPLYINNMAPFRRELRRDCAPTAKADLRQWYGARADVATEGMQREGMKVAGTAEVTAADRLRESRLTADPSTPLRVRTATDLLGEARVIGIEHG
jgi:hypothetical protein